MPVSNAFVSQLTDRQLMEGLRELARKEYALTADLLAHLGEIEARRLCDREAEGSLFRYCVKVLNFSEGAAYKRITAARLARRYPVILEMVACGDLHVSALHDLSPHLTAENHRELLRAARRLSKRELQELIARLFPKPDAPTLLRKLPERAGAPAAMALGAGAERTSPVADAIAGGSVMADVAAGRRAGASGQAESTSAGESCDPGAAAARSVGAEGATSAQMARWEERRDRPVHSPRREYPDARRPIPGCTAHTSPGRRTPGTSRALFAGKSPNGTGSSAPMSPRTGAGARSEGGSSTTTCMRVRWAARPPSRT